MGLNAPAGAFFPVEHPEVGKPVFSPIVTVGESLKLKTKILVAQGTRAPVS